MKAKLVKESFNENNLPNDIINLFLEIGSDIQCELGLDYTPISNMSYNSDNHTYECLVPDVADELSVKQLNSLRKMIFANYEAYSFNVNITYDHNNNGIIISLDA
jgi:hypothetical protein